VEDHLNRSLVLWVYNSEFDVVREVELIPRRGWGGEGALGAVLGFGALHRLPVGLGEEIQAPGEKLFDAEQRTAGEQASAGGESYFIVPEESKPLLQPQPPPFLSPNIVPQTTNPKAPVGTPLRPGAAIAYGKKSRHRGGASPSRAFEDMFEEGAKKSQEQDFVPSRKGTPVAPPPKLGGSVIASGEGPQHDSPSLVPAPIMAEDIGEPGDAEVM
jgi:GRASP55/65 PDZ-like domain